MKNTTISISNKKVTVDLPSNAKLETELGQSLSEGKALLWHDNEQLLTVDVMPLPTGNDVVLTGYISNNDQMYQLIFEGQTVNNAFSILEALYPTILNTQQLANMAYTDADNALYNGQIAQTAAAAAQQKADDAQVTADNAQVTADNAQNAANEAQATANNTISIMSAKQDKSLFTYAIAVGTPSPISASTDNVLTALSKLEKKADDAQNAANEAQSVANNALPKSGGTMSGDLIIGNGAITSISYYDPASGQVEYSMYSNDGFHFGSISGPIFLANADYFTIQTSNGMIINTNGFESYIKSEESGMNFSAAAYQFKRINDGFIQATIADDNFYIRTGNGLSVINSINLWNKVDTYHTISAFGGKTIFVSRDGQFEFNDGNNKIFTINSNQINSIRPINIVTDTNTYNNFYNANGGAVVTKNQLQSLYTVSSSIKNAVTAGAYNKGELSGSQPSGSLSGQKFVNDTHRFEFMPNMIGDLTWVRTAKV